MRKNTGTGGSTGMNIEKTPGVNVTPEEMAYAHDWISTNLIKAIKPPFSFVYDGKLFSDVVHVWQGDRASRRLDDKRIQHIFTYTDPQSGLTAKCEAIEYRDFPAVEWTVWARNNGSSDTPVLEDLQSLDMTFRCDGEGQFILHHYKGDYCAADSYEPYQLLLKPGSSHSFVPVGGRPSNGAFPYYNVQMPGGGLIVAVGWPGQWATQFSRDEHGRPRIRVGQELTHFVLHPGEQVRTPLIALLFWQGQDRARSQNLWRRWMIAHNMPRPSGELPPPIQAGNTSTQFHEMTRANEENQKLFIDRYKSEGIELDYWWMDAGWYPCDGQWPKVGTWEPDKERFPRGLRAISDHAHEQGVKILVWFEPERVAPGTWLYKQHPEWLLKASGSDQKLLDLGNSEALNWLTNHIDALLSEQGVDLYRQDFNIDPLPYWRETDRQDRQGITENHYVTGYLAYWDELRRRHPDMLIDSCASGGRRNDLETLRRAVPLHKTDYNYADLPVKQAFHHTLASWIPYFGAPVAPKDDVDTYVFRSAVCLSTIIGYDVRRQDLDYDLLRRLTSEWRQVAPYFYGDYYPLTSYSRSNEVWMAWQFDRPDLGEGIVQVFRRDHSPYDSARFRLGGLQASAAYTITGVDNERRKQMTGRQLMEEGLQVILKTQPDSAIICYRRCKDSDCSG